MDKFMELIQKVENYESIKDYLVPCLDNTEKVKNEVKDAPHKTYGDITLFYKIVINLGDEKDAQITVNDYLLNKYGVSIQQLHDDAVSAAEKRYPAKLTPLHEVIASIMGIPTEQREEGKGPKLYVASNFARYGSVCIFYHGFLDKAAETLGGSFYALPSSRHEFMFAREEGADAKELRDCVVFANLTEVIPEDFLSNQLYHYNAETGDFSEVQIVYGEEEKS